MLLLHTKTNSTAAFSAGAIETRLWFCIHSHREQEQRAVANLLDQGHPVLFPRYRGSRSNGYKYFDIIRPLFPTYLFAQFNPDLHLAKVLHTRGVHNVVSIAGEPCVVGEDVIESIQSRMDLEPGLVKLLDVRELKAGANVRVVQGSFAGQVGKLLGVKTGARERVIVLLGLLQRDVSVELRQSAVVRI